MRRAIQALALLWMLPAAGMAQRGDTVDIVSLQEVVSMALKSNPAYAVYVQQIRQAGYDRRVALGVFYPNASAGLLGTDNLYLAKTPVPGELFGQPGKTLYAQFGKHYAYSAGVTLTQNILNWQAGLQAKIAAGNLALTQSQESSNEQTLKEQVARSFYNILIARRSMTILAEDERAGDSLVQLAHQRLEEGTGDALAANSAEISFNDVRKNKALSQQLYDQGVTNLKILLGLDAGVSLRFAEPADADLSSEAAMIAPGPDKGLEVYRRDLDLAMLQRKAQRSAAYPTLAAVCYLGVNQYRDDFGISFTSGAWSGNRYIGLDLSVPLFTGLSNTNKYRAARVGQDIARMQLEAALKQSAVNDALMISNYRDYQEAVRASENNFRLYSENVRLYKQKWREGVITMDVYLKAFQDYLAAENTYMNDLSQLLSVQATIYSRS